MSEGGEQIRVRPTRLDDLPQIVSLSGRVYPGSPPWREEQLASHLGVFPEGQLVAVDAQDRVVGTAASLVVVWDDYDMQTSWRD